EDHKACGCRKLEGGIVLEKSQYQHRCKNKKFNDDQVEVVLIKHLKDGRAIVKVCVLYFLDLEVVVDVMVYGNLFFARDIQLLHRARACNLHLLLDLLIDPADNITEDVFVGKPEVDEEKKRHQRIARQQAGETKEH